MTKKSKFDMNPKQFAAMRHELGFTQREAADAIGVTALTISKWETGSLRVQKYAVIIYELLGRLGEGKGKE